MAKAYGPPEGYEAPDFDEYISLATNRFDMNLADEIDKQYLERLRAWCKEHGDGGDLVGEIVRYQIADGYAQYMVYKHKPLTLIHIGLHDAWSIPEAHERGLTLKDIRQQIEAERRLAEFFKKGT